MLPDYKTILCCHGFGPEAAQVLKHAFGIARCYHAKVVILHVIEPPSPQTQHLIDTYLPAERLDELHEESVRKVVADIDAHVKEICGDPGLGCLREVRVVEGHPGDRVLQEARALGADLIVMGSHRRSTVGELLLGSTAHRVAQHSEVPVLLVRLTE